METKTKTAFWVLMLAFGALMLSGCDARVVGASHLTSLGLACGMLWATLNLDRTR